MSDNKFKTGKIYKIYTNENNRFYIGSTIQELKDRFNKHKGDLKCMCKNLGVPIKDFIIELIENYPCNSKKELLWRERFYFDKYKLEDNLNFMNKNRPIITEEERKELTRNWMLEKKPYYYKGIYRDKRLKYSKQRYEKNKDKIRILNKEYYEINKEKIAFKKKNSKDKCNLCNSEFRKGDKKTHEKSEKHQVNDFLTLIDNSLSNINL